MNRLPRTKAVRHRFTEASAGHCHGSHFLHNKDVHHPVYFTIIVEQ